MKKKNLRKPIRKNAWDPHKDSIFKQLGEIVRAHGVIVRREDLKQGHGWKVMSGICRLEQERIIFVDRKLPQDEQITFLIQRMSAAGITPTPEQISTLPQKIQETLQASQSAIAA